MDLIHRRHRHHHHRLLIKPPLLYNRYATQETKTMISPFLLDDTRMQLHHVRCRNPQHHILTRHVGNGLINRACTNVTHLQAVKTPHCQKQENYH